MKTEPDCTGANKASLRAEGRGEEVAPSSRHLLLSWLNRWVGSAHQPGPRGLLCGQSHSKSEDTQVCLQPRSPSGRKHLRTGYR